MSSEPIRIWYLSATKCALCDDRMHRIIDVKSPRYSIYDFAILYCIFAHISMSFVNYMSDICILCKQNE